MLKKLVTAIMMSCLIFSQTVVLAEAAEFRSGDVLNFGTEDVLNNTYAAGNQLTINGSQIDNDVVLAARQASVEADIKGGLIAATADINLRGSVARSVRLAAGQAQIEAVIGQDAILWANQAVFSNQAKVEGDVIFSGGKLVIEGQVTGKVVAQCECQVEINGSVGSFEGFQVSKLTFGPKAVVAGNVTYQSRTEAVIDQGADIKGSVDWQTVYGDMPGQRQILTSQLFYGTLASLIFCFFLAYFVRRGTDQSLNYVRHKLPVVVLSGILTVLLSPIVATALILPSIWLGISLWLLVILLLLSGFFMGQIVLGWWLLQWWYGRANQAYGFDWRAPLIGAVVGSICWLVPVVGPIILAIFFAIGLGSLSLSLLDLRK